VLQGGAAARGVQRRHRRPPRRCSYPTISLTGAFGTVSGDLGDLLKGDSLIWSFGAGLFQPIFNASRLKRKYEAAQARYEQSLAQYQSAALNAIGSG
jgi:multidrug efflux system outer membrane protein